MTTSTPTSTPVYPPIQEAETYVRQYGTEGYRSLQSLNSWEQEALVSISVRVAMQDTLSEKQIALWWKLHEKTQESNKTGNAASASGPKFPNLLAFLRKAEANLQRPALYYKGLRIRKAGPYASDPEKYYITRVQDKEYLGYITGTKVHIYRQATTDHLSVLPFAPATEVEKGYLAQLEASPAEAIAKARMEDEISECCFCARTLTDDESMLRGYGPICAENYNMPYNHSRSETWIEEEL